MHTCTKQYFIPGHEKPGIIACISEIKKRSCQVSELLYFFLFKYSIYSCPQIYRASMTGENFFPISVNEYSTFGGIDSYCLRSTRPFSTRDFN